MSDRERVREVHITVHASQRGIERGVTEDEMREIVRTGTRRRQEGIGDRGGEIWLFSKTIRGRSIIVVGEVLQGRCVVITVMPGRF